MLPAESIVARSVDSAFAWIGGICLVLLIGITIAMIWFVVRYRQKRNPVPTQIEGNLKLEITWIIIPLILVIFMFFKGYDGFKLMRNVPANAMVVEVEAAQWFWSFRYPEEGITSDKLYAPVDRPVKLELHAADNEVVHSLYLPAFRIKEDCVPGTDTYLWFQSETVGTFNIFCAEYCGRDHSSMISELIVLSEADYEAWIEEQLALQNKPIEIVEAMDPASEMIVACDGAALYKTYCISCHGDDGRGGLVEDARSFTSSAGWKKSPKVTDIYRTLSEGIEGTRMRSFINVPPWDRFALAHHVAAFGAEFECTEDDISKLVEEYRLGEDVAPEATITITEAMQRIAEEAGDDGKQQKQ
jgi:cytochrome c oxidase subunit II